MKSTAKLSSIGTHFFKTLLQMPYSLLYAVDPSLGRLDYDSLSDQTLMEIFTSRMKEEHIEVLQDKSGNFLDVCEWENVVCTDDRVTHVKMSYWVFTEKPVAFEYIPPLVTYFEAVYCLMRGSLDTRVLPVHLVKFTVYGNSLSAMVDFRGLPRGLQDICISFNSFCGSCALENLPSSLSRLYADSNQFSGEISLNHLPSMLETLNLRNNRLHGSVVLKNLPQALRSLFLSANDFTGDFQLLDLPSRLKNVDICFNKWSGTVVLRKASGRMPFRLSNDDIKTVLDENGNTHAWEAEIFAQAI